MDDYQINALKDFSNLMHGNGALVGELIEILKKEVQPGGIETPYEGSFYPGIMTFMFAFNQKLRIYANCDEVNPASDYKQRTPASAIRRHFDSFTITKAGKPRGVKTYVPPYFMWFCSLAKKCEKDETQNRREIAKNFYNKVLNNTYKSKIPSSLKIWDENWSPPWIGAKPFPVFHTWEEVHDQIEGKRTPGSGPKPDDDALEIKRDILDPYNPNGIKFEGREKEIQRLNGFAYDSKKFKIWTVIAPSGAGKTRLVFEWTQLEAIKDHWEVFYFGQTPKGELVFHDPDHVYKNPHKADRYFENVLENGTDWEFWSPERDTILIIDYVSGFEDIINAIVNRCVRKNLRLDKRVRLLVLDHVFPETLKKLDEDERWKSIHDVGQTSVFYKDQPLHLTQTDDQADIMEKIIRSVALQPREDGSVIELTEDTVAQAIEYLVDSEKVKGTWHPLFAALVGDALRYNRSFNQLDRRKLIENYLNNKNRLPWKYPERQDKDANIEAKRNQLWASAFVSVAILLGGVKWQDFVEADYSKINNVPDDFGPIKTLCERVISKRIEDELPPLIPDIIGESLFLLLLKKISDIPDMKRALFRILESGDEKMQSPNVINFVTVMQRLTRNLLNDDQRLEETHQDWKRLIKFLKPERFPKRSPMRWAVSATLVNLDQQIRETATDNIHLDLKKSINSIESDDLIENIGEGWFEAALPIAFAYYQFCFFEDNSRHFLTDLISLMKRNDSSTNTIPSLHHLAKVGSIGLLRLVKKAGFNLDVKLKSTFRSPLMTACSYRNQDIALEFVDTGADINGYYGEGEFKITPLAVACLYSCDRVVYRLIHRGVNLDKPIANNVTPLMIALHSRNENIALALIKSGANIHATNSMKQSTLVVACLASSEKPTLNIVARNADVNFVDKWGNTALFYAIRNSLYSVAWSIIPKISEINRPNRDRETYLTLARQCKEKRPSSLDRWTSQVQDKDQQRNEISLEDVIQRLVEFGAQDNLN